MTKLCIVFIFILLSCSSQNKVGSQLIGKEYKAKTENRELILKIIDSENLEIKNIFDCTNIDEKYKTVTFQKKYDLRENKIILRDSIFVFSIPYFDNSNCKFLSEKYRMTKNERAFDGRLIRVNKEELYTIENIDTLKIVGKKLLYIKKNKIGTKGYLFE